MSNTTNPLVAKLAKRSTEDVQGATAWWRCRVLSPTEAVELQTGMAMIASAIKIQPEGQEAPALTNDGQRQMVAHIQSVACAVVRESSEAGKSWYPIRLVASIDQQDIEADPPRVYIGAIDARDIADIAFAATKNYREGRQAAKSFRGESETS